MERRCMNMPLCGDWHRISMVMWFSLVWVGLFWLQMANGNIWSSNYLLWIKYVKQALATSSLINIDQVRSPWWGDGPRGWGSHVLMAAHSLVWPVLMSWPFPIWPVLMSWPFLIWPVLIAHWVRSWPAVTIDSWEDKQSCVLVWSQPCPCNTNGLMTLQGGAPWPWQGRMPSWWWQSSGMAWFGHQNLKKCNQRINWFNPIPADALG